MNDSWKRDQLRSGILGYRESDEGEESSKGEKFGGRGERWSEPVSGDGARSGARAVLSQALMGWRVSRMVVVERCLRDTRKVVRAEVRRGRRER
jgi:hypothetical protein